MIKKVVRMRKKMTNRLKCSSDLNAELNKRRETLAQKLNEIRLKEARWIKKTLLRKRVERRNGTVS